MKIDRFVLQVNACQLMESGFWYDVTLSRWHSWCHFM